MEIGFIKYPHRVDVGDGLKLELTEDDDDLVVQVDGDCKPFGFGVIISLIFLIVLAESLLFFLNLLSLFLRFLSSLSLDLFTAS